MDFKKVKEILEEFFKKKKINTLIIIIVIMLFSLVAISTLKPNNDDNKVKETTVSGLEEEITKEKNDSAKDEYEKMQKEELANILQQINGVGNVDVMMTFESGEVKVPAYDKDTQTSVTEEEDSEGGKRTNEQKNDGSKVVMSTSDEGNEPFVIQTYKPKVIGVAIVAEGAEDSKTKYEIERTVSALYNLSADKVKVHPMKK